MDEMNMWTQSHTPDFTIEVDLRTPAAAWVSPARQDAHTHERTSGYAGACDPTSTRVDLITYLSLSEGLVQDPPTQERGEVRAMSHTTNDGGTR